MAAAPQRKMELHPLHGMKRMVAVRSTRKRIQKDIGEEYDEYKRALADVERQLKTYTDAAAASHQAWEALARVQREFSGAMSATYKRQDAIRSTAAQFAGNMTALQTANSLADNTEASWRKLHSIVCAYLGEIAEVNKLYDPVEREFAEYLRYVSKSDRLEGRRKRNEEKIARNIEKRDKHKVESSALLDNAVTTMRVTLRKHPAVFQCALAAFWLRNQNSLTLFTDHTGEMHAQCADIAHNLVTINLSDPSTYEQLLPPHSDPISVSPPPSVPVVSSVPSDFVERRYTDPVPTNQEISNDYSMPQLPIPDAPISPSTVKSPPPPISITKNEAPAIPAPKPLKKSSSKSLFGFWGAKSSRSTANLGPKSRSSTNITSRNSSSKKSIEMPGLLPSRTFKPKNTKQNVPSQVPDQKVEPHEISPLDEHSTPAPPLVPPPEPAPVPPPPPTNNRPPLSPPTPPTKPVVLSTLKSTPPPEKEPQQSTSPVQPKQSPSRVPTAIPPPSVAPKLDINSPNKAIPPPQSIPTDLPATGTTPPAPPVPPTPPTVPPVTEPTTTPPPAPALPEFGLGIRPVSNGSTAPPPPPPPVSS